MKVIPLMLLEELDVLEVDLLDVVVVVSFFVAPGIISF